MGYERHHAIVVTSFIEAMIEQAHNKATYLGMSVSNIIGPVMNGYRSFLIGPDGSKEGWNESERGDAQRAEFVKWVNEQRYEDLSTSLDWVEIQYADGELETKIISDSDQGRRE